MARKGFNRYVRDLLDEIGANCVYCGCPLRWAEYGKHKDARLTWDHVVPLSKGGLRGLTHGNVLPCCLECNGRKGSASVHKFRTALGGFAIERDGRYRIETNGPVGNLVRVEVPHAH